MNKHINFEPNSSIHIVGNWTPEKVNAIYQRLEIPNWAPWLAATNESLKGRVKVFPQGQLVIMNVEDEPLASLSMNRINWNGDPATLPSWDDVAGDPTTYEQTYNAQSNALVMMSMNVDPDHQGEGLAKKLIDQAKLLAAKLEVDYLIGSFRPNEFGKFKAVAGNESVLFEEYINSIRPDGLPIDSWLRNLSRNGMKPLKVDHQAMTVTTPLNEFYAYQAYYKTHMWKQVAPEKWECGEVGSWYIDATTGTATYQESNLWGIAWQKTGLV